MRDPRPALISHQEQVRRTQDLVLRLCGQSESRLNVYGIELAMPSNEVFAIHATIALATVLRMRPREALELVRRHDPHAIQTSAASVYPSNSHRQREFIMGLSITPAYRTSLYRQIVAANDGASIAYPSHFA